MPLSTQHTDIVGTLRALVSRAAAILGSVGEVAAAARVEPALLAALDGGVAVGWDTEAVGRLAECARVDPASVWTGEVPGDNMVVYLFETTWTDFAESDRRACLTALAVARTLKRMQDVVGEGERVRARRQLLPSPRDVNTAQAFRDGYQLASSVRQSLGLGNDAVPSMIRLLPEKLGIPVVFATLDSSRLEGLTAVGDGDEAVIVNRRDFRTETLRRLLAHELCHALFDPRSPDGNLAVLDRTEDLETKQRPKEKRASIGPDARERREQRARAFSAEFLLPEDGLIDILGIPKTTRIAENASKRVAQAMEYFDAPSGLVAWHLHNRGYIAESIVFDAAGMAERQVGRRRQTERRFDPVGDLLSRAFESQLISRGRAAELARIAQLV